MTENYSIITKLSIISQQAISSSPLLQNYGNTLISYPPDLPSFRILRARRRSKSGEAAAMAAPPLRSRHLSSTISRSIHGRCHRQLSSSLSLPQRPRRRSSHAETKSQRNEKKQELSRQGFAILSFVSLLNLENTDNPRIRLRNSSVVPFFQQRKNNIGVQFVGCRLGLFDREGKGKQYNCVGEFPCSLLQMRC